MATRASKTGSRRDKSVLKTLSGKPQRGVVRERGPRGWLTPLIESAYTTISARQPSGVEVPRSRTISGSTFTSALTPNVGEENLAATHTSTWIDRLAEYKRRRVEAGDRAMPRRAFRARAAVLGQPAIPGAQNWMPLGPSVVQHGQAQGDPPVGGRVSGLAVSPDGTRLYAASANGGVFRSDDGGMQWRSLMDDFDLDPTSFASTSLACGAIAIHPSDLDRVYVGTGEGDTHAMFATRIVNSLPAYRGIGPIRSDDGGATWVSESTDAGSPMLAGSAFYALAVDPTDKEHVLAATTQGLYRRQLAQGEPRWVQIIPGVWSALTVTSTASNVRFFAAEWSGNVRYSADGKTWKTAGKGFPANDVGRIALAVQPGNDDLVYALVSAANGGLLGLFRLDGMTSNWIKVSAMPEVFPADGRQGDYDLCVAVDPDSPNLVFVGGSYYNLSPYPASIWRCELKPFGDGYRAYGTPIGMTVHADVHVLMHTPGDSHTLWTTCDGGVFVNRDADGSGTFVARNNGLACLCTTFFGQHPTDPSILFCGLQDNGTARTSGGPIWTHVNSGDGGYCLVNWASPDKVLVFANGTIYRSTNGGKTEDDWTYREFPWRAMTEPIVGPPFNPSKPAEARRVAFGVGDTVYVSENFGQSWTTEIALPVQGSIFALAFANATRLFVGTTVGEVYRLDRINTHWQFARLDTAAGGVLPLQGIISDIAVDWHDASRNACYICLGGMGDYRHVWYFDGVRWLERSGPAGQDNLLDVEHNAIVVDPLRALDLYAGADIGVWRSRDAGATWAPMANGLPDAPVFDLQIHPSRRLLRAATHGRGMFEIALE